MDRLAPPYDPNTGARVGGGVLGQIRHIVSYASRLSSPTGPHGIASYPWQWLADYKPIIYLSINPGSHAPSFIGDHPQVLFLGMISPPIMLLALPALGLAGFGLWRAAQRGAGASERIAVDDDWSLGDSAQLGLAWFIATWIPYELFSLIWQRTSYLYYMIIVMPGIYLAVSAFVVRFARGRRTRWLVGLWCISVLAAVVIMYPFVPLF
jgi:hypothetical protein